MNKLSIYEALELNDLLGFKINCLSKAKAFINLVSDSELKSIIKENISNYTNDINELKQLLQEETF